MNSRDTQDVILRLLADAPFRARAATGDAGIEPDVAPLRARIDMKGLEHFGRFLCRHYYRERVVHYFKYARALAPKTGRPPETVLKSPEFNALMPGLVMGERPSAERVLRLLEAYLTRDADSIRAAIGYWDDLVRYQAAFFLSDAQPPEQPATPFPARAATSAMVDLEWDLPEILPALLKPSGELPMPARRKTTLLFSRSEIGEVTVLRCTDALKQLLENLTGREDPVQIASRMGLEAHALENTMERLVKMGAVVAQERFSSSHVGSEVSQPAAGGGT